MLCIHEVNPIVPTYLGILPPGAEAQGSAAEAKNSVFCILNSSTFKSYTKSDR